MWNKLQSIHQHHTQCGCNKQKWGRWVQSQPATSPKQSHPGTLAPWVCPKPMVHYKKLPFSCKPRITSRTSRFRGINPFPAWGGSASTLARCGCGFKQVGSLGMSWDQRTRWWDMYIYYICINLHLHILHSQYTYIYIYVHYIHLTYIPLLREQDSPAKPKGCGEVIVSIRETSRNQCHYNCYLNLNPAWTPSN